jgi:hypothetical protein
MGAQVVWAIQTTVLHKEFLVLAPAVAMEVMAERVEALLYF